MNRSLLLVLLAGCNYVEVFPPGANVSGGSDSSTTSGISAGGGMPCYGATVPSECATDADFHCEATAKCGDDSGCFCQPGSPDNPLDCVTTANFHCEQLGATQGCVCVDDSPMSADECGFGQTFHCELASPPTACDCLDPET